jgi:tetratricopeptide (TPR) repeat protein
MHRLLSFETAGFEQTATDQQMQLLPLVRRDTMMTRQYADKIAELSAAIMRSPSAELYFNRGVVRTDMIDFVAGLENPYQRISVDTDPANQLYGSALRGYDYSEAVTDFSTAIKRAPDFAEAWYNRGVLLARAGQLADAFEDFSRAIAIDPRFAEAWSNRGMVQIRMKDTRKGCLDLSKAGELGLSSAYEMLKKIQNYE